MTEYLFETVAFLKKKSSFQPEFGIVLGTGLGGLVGDIDVEHVFSYEDIPNFPVSTVESHKGKLIYGHLENKKVVVMQGRFHYYEGYSMQEVTFPIRILKLLGIKSLFISNAAGGLNPDFERSDLMIINDHINLLPDSPLRGPNNEDMGLRFPDMSEPYDKSLINLALDFANEQNIRTHQGVYAVVSGPNLETPAEYRYLSIIGADAVGMSTVPENIVARQMDLPCFAVSVITDMCVPGKIEKVTIEEVLKAAAVAEPAMTSMIRGMLARL
jgi:purine-nucleoside phosphorylase